MRLKHINTLLLILIILVNTYTGILPFVPQLAYAADTRLSERRQRLERTVSQSNISERPNSLIVPAMLLDQPILEGRDTYRKLDQGILRWPASSTPDKGGNTVLLGHRFTYGNPSGVFYHLDKLREGDKIAVVWENKTYRYRVDQTKVVPPSDTSILSDTSASRLTMYTCAPLLWPKERLVVTASLEAKP